jgi:hypothetical protein
MKKIYYYQDPRDLKLLSTITDQSWADLSKNLGLPITYRYVEKEINLDHFTTEDYLKIFMVEYLEIRGNDVDINPDKLKVGYLEIIRDLRNKLLAELDILALRAISQSNPGLAQQIEVDKKSLREIPNTFNFDAITTLKDFVSILPSELQIDYNDKYKGRL